MHAIRFALMKAAVLVLLCTSCRTLFAQESVVTTATRMEELSRELEFTKQQLENLSKRQEALEADDHQIASGVTEGTHAGCARCQPKTCEGLPDLCAKCKGKLSWNKGKFRVVPYGAITGEMIGSQSIVQLRGSPLFLVPATRAAVADSRFTVSGQQTLLGLQVSGPDLRGFKSGANVAVNFFGEQPVQNNPGLFFLFAYAELRNENWRIWFGQDRDAIGRLNTHSPAFTSHKMSGNFGQLRPGIRAERFFALSDRVAMSFYGGLTQQAVNDFIAVPNVSGTDNGWPNVEARWQLSIGKGDISSKPFMFALGTVLGETRALDDLGLAANNVSASWAVIPELRVESGRLGFQGEGFVGQAIGTYNGGIGQSLNPQTGEAIYSIGGFGELYYRWSESFITSVGYGIDDPRDSDLGTLASGLLGQRARNRKAWTNLIVNLSADWETRFEISHLETTYRTPSLDNQSMIYHWLIRYRF